MRPRTVQIDVVQVRRPSTLAVYPSKTTYDLENARVSPTVTLELPHGIVAEMYTIVDDALLLTWSNLNFVWTRGDGAAQTSQPDQRRQSRTRRLLPRTEAVDGVQR